MTEPSGKDDCREQGHREDGKDESLCRGGAFPGGSKSSPIRRSKEICGEGSIVKEVHVARSLFPQ